MRKPITKKTPVYFIDNQREKIIAEDEWPFDSLQHAHKSDSESGVLIHNQYENGNCGWFMCEELKVVGYK